MIGSGATGAVHKLIGILNLQRRIACGQLRCVVIVGPYEVGERCMSVRNLCAPMVSRTCLKLILL